MAAPPRGSARPIASVVREHVTETAVLREIRTAVVRSPKTHLAELARLDERLAAHLDGVLVAGPLGADLSESGLANGGCGDAFLCAVRALQTHDDSLLDRAVDLALALPLVRRGLVSAFGWAARQQLQGIVVRLLASRDEEVCALGIDACRLHRVPPPAGLLSTLAERSERLRGMALRAAGELGTGEVIDCARGLLASSDPSIAFGAAWAVCMLGGGAAALSPWAAQATGAFRNLATAAHVFFLAAPLAEARPVVKTLAASCGDEIVTRRAVIRAIGLIGSPSDVPWLIEQMGDPVTARAAGESLELITGVSLTAAALDTTVPEPPTTAAEHARDVELDLDDDEGLPWPDRELVHRWWASEASQFDAPQLFMGARLSAQHCRTVLLRGNQRQRAVAAVQLKLAAPNSALFNVASPAWRQQRLLSS